VLIALDGNVNPGDEMTRHSRLVSEICLQHDLLIATYTVPAHWLEERRDPLFQNLRREAVLV
jgi:hypothetical protein